MKAIIILLLVLFPGIEVLSQNPDAIFKEIVKREKYAGMGVCLFNKDSILWERGYGYSDMELRRPLEKDNIFLLCSLSKTVTAAAAVLLWERGELSLDEDIGSYLPFNVVNPNFPQTGITARMLLTHRGGFKDVMNNGLRHSYGVYGDSDVKLKDFVKGLFTPGGEYYDEENFSLNEPGTVYEYSNISFALLGYLVEVISKTDFAEFCKVNIFEPLAMNSTAWHIRDLDPKRFVKQYVLNNKDMISYKGIEPYSEHGYTAGGLRTTLSDFSRFIRMLMNGGNFDGKRILNPESVKMMLTGQGVSGIPTRSFKVKDIGLVWLISEIEGEEVYSMNGFSGSLFCCTHFSADMQRGVLYYFTGVSMENMQGMKDISLQSLTALKNIE